MTCWNVVGGLSVIVVNAFRVSVCNIFPDLLTPGMVGALEPG